MHSGLDSVISRDFSKELNLGSCETVMNADKRAPGYKEADRQGRYLAKDGKG